MEEIRSLGELCVFMPKSDNYSDLCIIIRKAGKARITIDAHFSNTSSFDFIIKADNDILTKYIYYYLRSHIDRLQDKYSGSAIKCLSKIDLESIEILIPTEARQIEIVSNCEANDLSIIQLDSNIRGIQLLTKSYF